jgi:hypothetical protein
MTAGVQPVNWWRLAGGLSALICTAGHAAVGVGMFYRPIKAAIADHLQAGIFTGMWHLITINFALSAIALIALGVYGPARAVALLVAAQFAGYGAI